MRIYPELIEGCIRNDRKSQFLLYRECHAFMKGICHRYTNSADEASELLNTCFLKVLNKLHTFKQDCPFEPWLKRIIVNTAIDAYRKSSKGAESIEYHEPFGLLTYDVSVELEEGGRDISSEQVLYFMQKLPHMSRRVFNLFAIDGFSHKEIAGMLSISEGTSKWHVSTAREKLKELIVAFMGNKKQVNA